MRLTKRERRALATVQPDMSTNTGRIAEIADVTNATHLAGNLVRKGILWWDGWAGESAGWRLLVTPVGRAVLRREEVAVDA